MKSKFGERLREQRILKGLTQRQLGEIFSVTNPCVARWENNINRPDFETLMKIAKYFDVSTDYLLGFKDY